jgi:hypothetical protein
MELWSVSCLKPAARSVTRLAIIGDLIMNAICVESTADNLGMLIDDFSDKELVSALGTRWRPVSDRVMGGISEASVTRTVVDGHPCLRLSGAVRLENDGGFIQASLDLDPAGRTVDATGYTGIRLKVSGNSERYSLHLRTKDTIRPWQSYRAQFVADRGWKIVEIPFATFIPHRLDAPLDIRELRRIGLAAIGRAFQADLSVAGIEFY